MAPELGRGDDDAHAVSWRSRVGLNAVNFALAEVVGVVIPILDAYLRTHGWRYDAIGLATALVGLGTLLAQTPAGFLVDRVRMRRGLLAFVSLLAGACFGLVPVVVGRPAIADALLFTAGACQAFFVPLLAALALMLVGRDGLSRTLGVNQSWNHAGNIAAALTAMVVVSFAGPSSVFAAVAATSVLAAVLVLLIRPDELDERRLAGGAADGSGHRTPFRELLRDRRVRTLFVATALFHLANAPVMPLVALDVKALHGTDREVAAVVLVAQAVMVPVALATGWLCDRWGRKPTFAIAFVVLPVRIALYALARTPSTLVALQALDGIGAGIYGVAIVAVCADLTRGRGQFNALMGVIATALAVGGVVGPVGSGLLVQHLGFRAAFVTFAGLAALAALVFVVAMPETREGRGAYALTALPLGFHRSS